MRVTTSQFEITRKTRETSRAPALSLAFAAENIKNLPLILRARLVGKSTLCTTLCATYPNLYQKPSGSGDENERLDALVYPPCSRPAGDRHKRLLADVGHFVSFSWHSSWYINAFAYLSRRFFTLSSPCGVKLNCWLKAGMRNHLKN